jgi:phospholipid-binding lipoprotein MlaA
MGTTPRRREPDRGPWLAAGLALLLVSPAAGHADLADCAADLCAISEPEVERALEPPPPPPVETAVEETAPEEAAPEVADYDPWEPFNERMFWFNHGVLDRYVVKPAATGWGTVLPDPARRHLGQAFENLEMPRRLVNNLLQLRPLGAGQELLRFVINTTAGIAGFFDVAGALHIEESDADAGQTLGVYGVGPGPYLCLPFLPPLTVRDGIGSLFDSFLDPLGQFVPFPTTQAMSAVRKLNQRSLQLEISDEVEEVVLDLYTAARNSYLQRRQRAIDERRFGEG